MAQTPPEATILELEVQNRAVYYYQDFDVSKWGTVAGPVTPKPMRPFCPYVFLGDVTAVNGKPAKGTYVLSAQMLNLRPDASAGQAIADVTRAGIGQMAFEILTIDGTQVGTIFALALAGGSMPPGGPLGAAQGNLAIVGGTGAFFGARGTVAQRPGGAQRMTNVEEDPANRRIHGGDRSSFLAQIIPMFRPEITTVAAGPAIYHASDLSPVTAEAPARAGEWLIMSAVGLGPTRPGIDLGRPFPPWVPGKEELVNSPVEVTVAGKPAEVRNAIGWPGHTNVYRVDFRVPEGTPAGTATLGLSVAWINGPEVKIPVR
ncbi:MAG: hypothetical protein AAB225_18050 [Acidobacteriota bacterium]